MSFDRNNIVSIYIDPEYETPEGAETGGFFQVKRVILTDKIGNRIDVTEDVDQEIFFENYTEIADELNLNSENIYFENAGF